MEVTAHVDNITAVNANNQNHTYPGISSHTAPNIDLLLEIWKLKIAQINIQTEWVEAHQDTKYPESQLSGLAQLNNIADADASQYKDTEHTINNTPPILPSAAVILT
eukprot:3708621-Ditylum_brightwellii.AAC.1